MFHNDPRKCPGFAMGFLYYVLYCLYKEYFPEPSYENNDYKRHYVLPGKKAGSGGRGRNIGPSERATDKQMT